jgi:hypothetical protein
VGVFLLNQPGQNEPRDLPQSGCGCKKKGGGIFSKEANALLVNKHIRIER